MRYKSDFPAKTFLSTYREDYEAFLARAEEMGEYGKLSQGSKGHWLKAPYSLIYEFKMPLTRAFGFTHDRDFIVTNAAKKAKKKAQIPDYDRALMMRNDYLQGLK